MAAKFVPVDIVVMAHDYNLTGELTTATVGSISVGELSSSAVDFRRTAANIRRGDMGGVKVSVQLRGRGLIVQNGREAVLNPGDFAVYDTSTPYAMHYASRFDTLVLMFPRASLKITSDELRRASAQRIPGDHGIGALVSQFLISLRPRLRAGTLSTTPMMEDAILDLISAVAIDNTQFGRIPARASLLVGARTFIGAHLAEPDLDTSKVAAALHISPRYLQKLFAQTDDCCRIDPIEAFGTLPTRLSGCQAAGGGCQRDCGASWAIQLGSFFPDFQGDLWDIAHRVPGSVSTLKFGIFTAARA